MEGTSTTSPSPALAWPDNPRTVPTISESVNSLGMTKIYDANSVSEINSRMLPLSEFSTPKKRQCFSQDGSLFKPVCDEAFKPTVGMKFDDIASVEAFYKNYAHHVGFGVRLGPQRMVNNVIHWKRFLCAREGYRSTKGGGFLLNEATEDYIWLFEAFLKSMGGVAPGVIVTDESGSMKNAIEAVLPNTVHRLCMWHILQVSEEKMKLLVFGGL